MITCRTTTPTHLQFWRLDKLLCETDVAGLNNVEGIVRHLAASFNFAHTKAAQLDMLDVEEQVKEMEKVEEPRVQNSLVGM